MSEDARFCHDAGRAFLETRDLTKTYRLGREDIRALEGVDFVANQGDFVVLNGPSGSGKTTFLNLISAIDRPTQGEVIIEGVSTTNQTDRQLAAMRRNKIGLVFQSFNLIPVLSAAENVEYPLLLHRLERPERKRRVSAMLEEVGLGELTKRRPNELSGGQRQRVAIARALVTRPRMVLADEPTANLDSETGKAVMQLTSRLNKEHCVVFIVVTHDPAVTIYAQRRFRILDGHLTEEGNDAPVASTA